MQAFSVDDLSTAIRYYQSIADPNAQRLFDFFIDNPEQQRTARELQRQLGFPEHRDVARSTYLLGNLAAELGRSRPWAEGQPGYQMPSAMATLFSQARAQAG